MTERKPPAVLPVVTDVQLEALADLVAERLEQRHRDATVPQHWTDHLAATLDRIHARRVASGFYDHRGDHPEPGLPGMDERPAASPNAAR